MFVRGPVDWVLLFVCFALLCFLTARVQLLQIFFCCSFKNEVCREHWMSG